MTKQASSSVEAVSREVDPELERRVAEAIEKHGQSVIAIGLMPADLIAFLTVAMWGLAFGRVDGESRDHVRSIVQALIATAGAIDPAFREFLQTAMDAFMVEAAQEENELIAEAMAEAAAPWWRRLIRKVFER